MEGKRQVAVVEEETPDFFLCCICLDLLYKPVVLPCGHMSCFWCVHRSMSGVRESRCPICRHSYKHFPGICQMLHFLLLKMYPVAYKRREEQMLGEEKITDCFSPQLVRDVHGSSANLECDRLTGCADSSTTSIECNSSVDLQSLSKGEACASVTQDNGMSSSEHVKVCEMFESIAEEKTMPPERNNENCKQLSAADVMCVGCRQMLFHPVVLNCGHAYCESCIPDKVNEVLRCKVCQCVHPSAFGKVCLELHHFLERLFPKEYAMRRDADRTNNRDVKAKSMITCSDASGNNGFPVQESPTGKNRSQQADSNLMVHFGFGCDYCGMCPIIGDRYRCKDCVEKMGFDLCGDCYNTRSKLPGRFNQQHTPEHVFEHVNSFQNWILLAAESQGLPINFADVTVVSELLENELPFVPLSGEDSESIRQRLVAPILETDEEENEDDAQSSLVASVAHTEIEEDQNDSQPH